MIFYVSNNNNKNLITTFNAYLVVTMIYIFIYYLKNEPKDLI